MRVKLFELGPCPQCNENLSEKGREDRMNHIGRLDHKELMKSIVSYRKSSDLPDVASMKDLNGVRERLCAEATKKKALALRPERSAPPPPPLPLAMVLRVGDRFTMLVRIAGDNQHAL